LAKPSASRGSITIICGSMFSGKTEELIRLVRRAMHARKRVQVFKSALDTRCDTTLISTHDGTSFHAIAVGDSRQIAAQLRPDTQLVGIEEIQFLDDGVVALCQRLADSGVEVIAAGLDQDFRGEPFGFMPVLMALADNVMKLHAICKVCGEEASRTQRLVDGRPAAWDEPTILIGADETYEARCRHCHQVRQASRRKRAHGAAAERRQRKPRATDPAATNGKEGTETEEVTQLTMFPQGD
jgi:thymidine kinase